MKFALTRILAVTIIASMTAGYTRSSRADETNHTQPEAKPETKPKKQVFFFGGGNPIEFIFALDRHFRTRLEEILSIPSSLAHAQVPKMRMSTDDPGEALALYNRLDNPYLGRWVWDPPSAKNSTNLNVLTLIPNTGATPEKPVARVKAIALGGIPEDKWRALEEDVATAQSLGRKDADRRGSDTPDGEIHIQSSSKVLIVSGSDGFIEMVESVVAAHRANAEFTGRKPSEPAR